jgi:hypothetical protein
MAKFKVSFIILTAVYWRECKIGAQEAMILAMLLNTRAPI